MKRRPTNTISDPPPFYRKKKNIYCTLCLHYGGQFSSDLSEWAGGEVTKFDWIVKETLDILWVIGIVKKTIGCSTHILLYGRHINAHTYFLIRTEAQLADIVEEHINAKGEFDIYIVEGEGVEVSVDGHSSSSEGVGIDDRETGTAKTKEVWTSAGVEEETNSHQERRRKGKTPVVKEEPFEDSFSEDSDFELDSDGEASDDRLFESNVDQDAEWLGVEDDTLAVVNVVDEESEGDKADLNLLGEEDLVESDDDFRSVKSDDDFGEKVPVYSERHKYNPVFILGMVFRTKKEFKELVDSHSIIEKRSVLFTKSDKVRVYAKFSDPECPFKIHLRKRIDDNTFEITTLFGDHTCVPVFKVKNMNSKWLTGRYGYEFLGDRKRNVEGFREHVSKETGCDITWWQAYKSKRLTLKSDEGSAEEQYALLWAYANEIRRTNPDSTVKLGVEQVGAENKFSKFYVCLGANKKGFLNACRPIFGVDGTFLKGLFGGILLTAVGIDPNNNLYPIAWAVVSKEDGLNWEWFLRTLKTDLDINSEYEWTIVSDKQNGLVKAVGEVFPNAHHRFCVTHMHSNFVNAGFRGQVLKTALWKAAKATTVGEFRIRMEEMKKLNAGAYDWLKDKHPSQWSRSHHSTYPRCDVLVNNMCESFNSLILPAREMPILSCLEKIMSEMMKRMRECRELGARWKGPYCPRIQKVIDFNTSKVAECKPMKSSDDHYQISCFDGTQYAVDLKNGTCGCGKWDLTGIPCKHALCAISCQKLSLNGFVHRSYTVEAYREAYSHCIMPINGRTEWEPSDAIPPLPPKIVRQAGRPPRARRRDGNEPVQKTRKRVRGRPPGPRDAHHKRRNQVTLSCTSCGRQGHNKRSCERIHEEEAAMQQEEAVHQEGVQQEENLPEDVPIQEDVPVQEEQNMDMDEEVQVNEEVIAQSQFTQATEIHDDNLVVDENDLAMIDELISQRSIPNEEPVVAKRKGKQKVGSSVNCPSNVSCRCHPHLLETNLDQNNSSHQGGS